MKIPEGWPTEEMIDAAGTALLEIEGSQKSGNHEFQTIGASVSHIVKAALAAAPTPPARQSRESVIYDLTAPLPFKTPPAQEDEPVAYAAKNYRNGKWGYIWHEKDDVQGWIILQHQSRDDVTYTGPTPLYTHPQSDDLRKAAEELHNFLTQLRPNMHNWLSENKYMHVMENLRATLKGKS